jgi:hypothetical protein
MSVATGELEVDASDPAQTWYAFPGTQWHETPEAAMQELAEIATWKPTTDPRRDRAGRYDYWNRTGTRVLFRKIRYNWIDPESGEVVGKDFKYEHQPQPPAGIWIAGKPDYADQVLYRFPELFHSTVHATPDSVVYWLEGESDCDAVAEALQLPTPPPGPGSRELNEVRLREMRRGKGMDRYWEAVEAARKARLAFYRRTGESGAYRRVATAHHGGAGHVTPAQVRWFRRFPGRVVIVADRDLPGAADAVLRRGLLTTAEPHGAGLDGGRVAVVRARAGKDAKDHLAAGYRLTDLVPASERRLVRAARAYLSGAIERAEHSGYLRSAGRLAAIRLFLPNKKLRTA